MVCTANELLGWKDFPKGLRVLLLDEDNNSCAEIRSKLEEMDYIVSIFCSENEALSALLSKSQIFHVAIVEVSTGNSHGSFTFLENAKDLPTIMTSNIHCLSTMMKCIAHGAVEFLHKPLSEEKLRNIWQHVVHKAFNAAGSGLAESLKPINESVASMLQLQLEHKEPKNQSFAETENVSEINENNLEQSSGSDTAPATPQLKNGGRLLVDGDCQDQTSFPTEKDIVGQDGECKSVETTCGSSVAKFSSQDGPPHISNEAVVKKEDDYAGGSKSESNISQHPRLKNGLSDTGVDARNQNKVPGTHNSNGTRSNRKKMKVDWTPELHKKFVQAVEKLGVDQAIPSRILESMQVQGLTRHNVASHLQKYRMHRRHILPKEEGGRFSHPRDAMQRGYFQHKPVMAYPSFYSNQTLPTSQVYPVWGQPGGQLPVPGVQLWGPPGYPTWQPADSWFWNPYPAMHADAWGCPVMPPAHGPYSSFPQYVAEYQSASGIDNGCCMTRNSLDLHPGYRPHKHFNDRHIDLADGWIINFKHAYCQELNTELEEEVIDRVVREAISKPWLPLPLGLKPPSTECVLAELCRQGISNIPPQT